MRAPRSKRVSKTGTGIRIPATSVNWLDPIENARFAEVARDPVNRIDSIIVGLEHTKRQLQDRSLPKARRVALSAFVDRLHAIYASEPTTWRATAKTLADMLERSALARE